MSAAALRIAPSTCMLRATYFPEREICRGALRTRFGWLIDELELVNGNFSALPEHIQTLWHGRARAVRRFNRIGLERDLVKRAKAYQRLAKELER